MARLGRAQPFKPLIRRRLPAAFFHLATLSEAITIVDTVGRTTGRVLSDVVALVDTLNTIKILSVSLIDVVILVDTVAKTMNRLLAEAVTMVDSVKSSIGRQLAEAIVLVTSFATLTVFNLTFTLTVVIEGLATEIRATFLQLLDSLVITDSIAFLKKASGLLRGLSRGTSTGRGSVGGASPQRGKSTMTNTKIGIHKDG